MTASKVTVLPVPATDRTRHQDPDPKALITENERLRAENAMLRERLANVQAIALEREQRIEDLKHALRMLPSVWARKLEERLGPATQEASPPAAAEAPVTAEEPATTEPSAAAEAPAAADPAAADEEPPLDRAEALLEEVAALRARLERRRLEVEHEMLEQERRSLAADLAWTRRWRRFRRARAAVP